MKIILFTEVLASITELHNRAKKVMLSKGIFIRPPYIPTPEKVDVVKKQSFLTGFFGERRPPHVIEISHLYANVQTNSFGKALMTGFGQVAKSQEVKQFMLRSKHIAQKHYEIFSSILSEEDLAAPVSWDSHSIQSIM
jgi:hypothetical protein